MEKNTLNNNPLLDNKKTINKPLYIKELTHNIIEAGNINKKEPDINLKKLISKFEEKYNKNIVITILDTHIQPNGNIAGIVNVGGINYPFIGDEIKEYIGNQKIEYCSYIHTQPNGNLAGLVRIGGITFPFIGDKIIKTIGGKNIYGCDNIHTQPNGNLAGIVKIGGNRCPFIGDKIIEFIGVQKIEDCYDIHTKSNGVIAGEIIIRGKTSHFNLNEISNKNNTKNKGFLAKLFNIFGFSLKN